MKKIEFNGYDFQDKKNREKMKYLIIKHGDLDLNNAYAFANKKSLLEYIKDRRYEDILAVFSIKEFKK